MVPVCLSPNQPAVSLRWWLELRYVAEGELCQGKVRGGVGGGAELDWVNLNTERQHICSISHFKHL